MSRSGAYIPLSDTHKIPEMTGDVVDLALDLPVGLDLDKIGVDAGRLRRLAHLAGGSTLSLCTDAPDQEPIDISGVSVEQDGSITGMGVRANPVFWCRVTFMMIGITP